MRCGWNDFDPVFLRVGDYEAFVVIGLKRSLGIIAPLHSETPKRSSCKALLAGGGFRLAFRYGGSTPEARQCDRTLNETISHTEPGHGNRAKRA